jgi:hypothetical protein
MVMKIELDVILDLWLFSFFVIIIINVGVRVSLRTPRLILWALKLTTMQISSCHEICETRYL